MGKNTILLFATQHKLTGGIESHLQEFCSNMGSHGIEIDLVILNNEMSSATEKRFREICRNFYSINWGRSKWRLAWLIKTGLQLSLRKYKSLYTNGQGYSISLFAKFIFRKKKWVHHHHTSGDLADQLSWRENYIATLKKADNVIACSSKNASYISKAIERNVNSIPCFSRKIPQKGIRQPGKIRLGYYGRLIPEKGIDVICKMSDDIDLNHVEFHLWGEGESYPPTYFNEYKNLNFHGPFFGAEGLNKVIGLLDGFLLISTNAEGLPICLLEGMGAGLPWFATDKGGIADIVCSPYSTKLISSDANYLEIKNGILNFIKDIETGLTSDKSQIELYQRKFSSDSLIKQWKEMLIP